MHPLQNGSQVTERPANKPVSGLPGYFTESGENNVPSYPGADWFNHVIDEFLNVLSLMGIQYDPDTDLNLTNALKKVFENYFYIDSQSFGNDSDAFDLFLAELSTSGKMGVVTTPLQLTRPVTLKGNITFFKDSPLILSAELSGNDFVTFGEGFNAKGHLKIDCSSSSVSCNNPAKFSRALQYESNTAPNIETLEIIGGSYLKIAGGLIYDATEDGGDGRSYIHFTRIGKFIGRFIRGIRHVADESVLSDSWVTANTIEHVTLASCDEYLVDDALNGAEVSNNTIEGTFQYGAGRGRSPTKGIEINAGAYNHYHIFIYDWNSQASPGPQVKFDNQSHDNTVHSSPLSTQKQDNGYRNRYISYQDSSISNVWISAWERSYLGHQDNVLAHWSTKAGSLVSTSETVSGDRTIVQSGDLQSIEQENESFLSLTSTGTTGLAVYTIEFRSLTEFPLTSNMVSFKFEEGFLPDSITIQVDDGGGYENVASSEPSDSEAFFRFDENNGTDIRTNIRGYKLLLSFSDNRKVRIRHVAANGTFMTCFPSRGGDFVGGDFVWKNGVGPILTNPNGGEFRLQVDNSGNLVLTPNPVKKTTFL